jgi:hypothetical protein
MSATKFSRKRFYLGTEIGGSVYIFTALGMFKSITAARAKAHESSRNGDVFIYSDREVSLHGTVYGCTGLMNEATAVRDGRPVPK